MQHIGTNIKSDSRMPRPICVPAAAPTLYRLHEHHDDGESDRSSDEEEAKKCPLHKYKEASGPLGPPPEVVPAFQIKARRRLAAALKQWEDSVEEEKSKPQGTGAYDEHGVNVLEHRAKFVRQVRCDEGRASVR